MMDAGRHPNITLLSYSEVEEVSGYVGNFKVKVRKKARYVDEDTCTGCGLCWTECLTRRVPSLKLIKMGEMSIGERRPGER
jgi:heterodisulfide reductase subunit A